MVLIQIYFAGVNHFKNFMQSIYRISSK